MNPLLASDLASCHACDLRDLERAAPPASDVTANRRHRPSPLRRQIGFRMMEAGLHLVSSSAD